MSELEVYRQPEAGRYGDLRILDEGQAISPLLLDLEVVWWG